MTGTRKSTEDYGNGNWTNPYVQAENQRAQEEAQAAYAHQPQGYTHPYAEPISAPYAQGAYQPEAQAQGAASAPVASYAPPRVPRRQRRRPAFSLARRFFCILLALLTLATGLGAATAYWAHTTLIDTDNFAAMTEAIAYDQDFQTSLASAVTDDIMASPAIETYLGDGNSTAWYGGVQNWLYDQTYTLVDGATNSLVTSDAYPQLWAQVISDTHAYNFSGESRPAVLDLSALYDQAGASVQSATGFGVDTSSLPGRTITLDTGQNIWPINSTINTLIWLASLWQPLLVASGVSALLGFLLWPRNRFAYLAFIAFSAAALLWIAGLLGGGASLTAGIQLPASSAAVLFLQKLSETITASFASYHNGLALNLLIAGAVLTLLALLSAIMGLTAREATARTR
ncbi:hypothetical protein [Rothia nasimurium]|uniref:hypothetical protein n=1 Tax=Rothia nasimurium TaxID=85336 RepID=UPI001F302AE5|nr:hypothetical protein [Rothia nasimurium]